MLVVGRTLFYNAYLGRPVFGRGLSLSKGKSVALTVVDALARKTEYSVENLVYEVDYRLVRAEVFRHKEACPDGSTGKLGQTALGICEDIGICVSEAVDALLHVSDHKSVILARDSLEDLILYIVYVLVLVNVNRREGGAYRERNVGGSALLPETFVGKTLDVGKGERAREVFFRSELRIKFLKNTNKHLSHRVKPVEKTQKFVLGVEEVFFIFENIPLHPVAERGVVKYKLSLTRASL